MFITVCNAVAKVMFLQASVCPQGSTPLPRPGTPRWTRYTPLDQVHPLGTRYTPRDQVHLPGDG